MEPEAPSVNVNAAGPSKPADTSSGKDLVPEQGQAPEPTREPEPNPEGEPKPESEPEPALPPLTPNEFRIYNRLAEKMEYFVLQPLFPHTPLHPLS